jgi:hypothetical protein
MSRTRVIMVSGSHGKCGKTTLVEKLVPCFGNCAAIKAQAHDGEVTVTAEDDPAQSPGKDTSRALAAGARRAYLVHGQGDAARDAVRAIIDSAEFDTVIVESNALSGEIEGALKFFVQGGGAMKASAAPCRERADIVVVGAPGEREEQWVTKRETKSGAKWRRWRPTIASRASKRWTSPRGLRSTPSSCGLPPTNSASRLSRAS